MSAVPLIITNLSSGWNVRCTLVNSAALSRAGGSSASASSGSSGWQVVTRSRQKAATEWSDYNPFVMTCTCMIDLATSGGWGGSVEPWIDVLETFEIPVPGSQPPLPPILTVSGPVPHTDLFWVCSRLDFDGGPTGQIRNVVGDRTQQSFKLELTEYSPSTSISTSSLSPAQLAAAGSASLGLGTPAGQTTNVPSGKSYTVRGGDTLQSVAVGQLGNVSLWPQLAILNGLSNSARLSAGQVLLLPATT